MFFKISVLIYMLCSGASSVYSQQIVSDSTLQEHLYAHVRALAHDSMQGRLTGTLGMYQSAVYIKKQFKEIGLNKIAGFENYEDNFAMKGRNGNVYIGVNIVAAIPGTTRPEELIIFSAHYDHVGDNNHFSYKRNSGNEEDNIFNGANDNASGVAALIEIARSYKQSMERPERTILFVAFAGEEEGLLGSNHFAQLLGNKMLVKANINLEMLGRIENKNIIVTGSEYSDFLTHLSANLKAKNILTNGYTFIKDNCDECLYFSRSDNFSFAQQNILAHTIMGGDGEPYYHRASDEIETLDFVAMTNAVHMITEACRPMLYHQRFKWDYSGGMYPGVKILID